MLQFNKMADYNLQNVYLRGLIESQPVKNRGNRGCDGKARDCKGNAKTRSYQYFVQTPALSCVQVWLVMTYSIILPRFLKHLVTDIGAIMYSVTSLIRELKRENF